MVFVNALASNLRVTRCFRAFRDSTVCEQDMTQDRDVRTNTDGQTRYRVDGPLVGGSGERPMFAVISPWLLRPLSWQRARR